MKKYSIILAFLCTSFIAQSQISIGIKAGINVSKLITADDNLLNDGYRSGFVGGAYVNIGWGSMYIQPELIFSQKGGNLKYKVAGLSADFTRDINSFDVPVLLGFRFGDETKFRVNAGPVFSFLASAKQDSESRYKDALSDTSVGAQLGIGFDIYNFAIDLRYEIGLSGVGKNSYVVGNQTFKTNDSVSLFQLTLGYKISN